MENHKLLIDFLRNSGMDPPRVQLLLLGVDWVQTSCNGYQQTPLAGKELILLISNSIAYLGRAFYNFSPTK